MVLFWIVRSGFLVATGARKQVDNLLIRSLAESLIPESHGLKVRRNGDANQIVYLRADAFGGLFRAYRR